MLKRSVAGWRMPGNIARHANSALRVAVVLAAAGRSYGAAAGEPISLEQHAAFDRLVIEGSAASLPVPLLRLADGRYRLILPQPVRSIPTSPRGLSRFAVDKTADNQVRVLELTPAPGSYLRYLTTARGHALDVVHGIDVPMEIAAIAPAAAAAGPLPPRPIHMGLMFAAPRVAAFRIGEELVVIVPLTSDLDPSGVAPARVVAVATSEQGRYRIIRFRLRPETTVEVCREGDRHWRLGFGTQPVAALRSVRFASGGRSAVFAATEIDPELATVSLPEFGTVAVLLADRNWASGSAQSPYLKVLDALVGSVVLPGTDGISIERSGDGLMVSATDRRMGG